MSSFHHDYNVVSAGPSGLQAAAPSAAGCRFDGFVRCVSARGRKMGAMSRTGGEALR
jgi:hypothetical protein